jgi:hypothetical protein
MRKEILIPALGWICSGIISLFVWYLQNGSVVCNYPEIPVNATKSQIASLCRCNGPMGLLYIGIFVIIVGIALILENKKLAEMMDKYKRKELG